MLRMKWNGVITDGLRALVNLMPGAYEGNQILNVLLADPWTKDDLNTMCAFTAKTLRKMESEGHIKWNYMDAICNVLENTKIGDFGPIHSRGNSTEDLWHERLDTHFV